MDNKIFNVLWFDDNPKRSFIDIAGLSNIKITNAKDLEKGIGLLSSYQLWDAFIFDANYKKKEEEESSLMLSNTINEVVKITKDKVPWFVLTAGDFAGSEAISYIIPESKWENEFGTKRFYGKVSEDEEVLFEDIKKTVNRLNSIEWKTKNKFSDVLEIFNIENEAITFVETDKAFLLNLLITIESGHYSTETQYLNEIRKFVAGSIMKTLSNMGVIPAIVTDLNAKSKHLGDFRFIESIPVHVQRAFHSIISTCQDGSHAYNEGKGGKIPPQIDKLVREGKAPYLIYSLVYELLNILIWLKSFVCDFNCKDDNLKRFTVTEGSDDTINEIPKEDNKIVGKIEQDNNGNFHCNEYLLNYTYVSNNHKVGDEIEITEFQDNGNSRTSFYYSKYATKFKKI